MTLKDLNGEQRLFLKQDMLTKELLEIEGRTPSYGELADADEIVTDEALEREHGGTEFVEGDFFA